MGDDSIHIFHLYLQIVAAYLLPASSRSVGSGPGYVYRWLQTIACDERWKMDLPLK